MIEKLSFTMAHLAIDNSIMVLAMLVPNSSAHRVVVKERLD